MSDYYCSQKFWWLTVNAEKQNIASCCSATPVDIDYNWLADNPGQLFNTQQFCQDRRDMLDNIPPASCEQPCWRAEQQGLNSRRLLLNSNLKTHTDINSRPEFLNLVLHTDCNLTCSYCCKELSSSWLRDINTNGPYFNDDRNSINFVEKLLLKIGQKNLKESTRYQQLLAEIENYKDVATLDITGGEPFLYNGLEDLVAKFSGRICISTGLGVNSQRLERMLSQLPLDRTLITISAENIGSYYEFNRYGNSYEHFLKNVDIIKRSGVNYRFWSVISNLTIFGFKEFIDQYSDNRIEIGVCNEPAYLSANILDYESKESLLALDYGKFDNVVKKILQCESNPQDEKMLKHFVTEFAQRRNLDLSIFPKTFLNWIENVV